VTPQSLGSQLRKLREQHRVTLEVIEKKTKVSMSLLRSLENGGCEGWPGGIYSRGYVRAYAEAIGVDPEHVLAAFVECYPAFAPAPIVEAELEPEAPPPPLFERIKAVVAGWFRYAAAAPAEVEAISHAAWPVADASEGASRGARGAKPLGQRLEELARVAEHRLTDQGQWQRTQPDERIVE
jgi:transcriptional regulator with XRE-family HTH domain